MLRPMIVASSAILIASAAFADYSKGNYRASPSTKAAPHYDVDVDVDSKGKTTSNNALAVERDAAKNREKSDANKKVASYDIDVDVEKKGYMRKMGINGRYCNTVTEMRTGRC